MEWTFVESAGRGIDVALGADWPGFNEALADSVSSMPPRQAWSSGLSSYWIDHAVTQLTRVSDGQALTWGNSTELVRQGDKVIARSLYEMFDDEEMTVASFRQLMAEWRAEVYLRRKDFRIGKTYRRNGFKGSPTRKSRGSGARKHSELNTRVLWGSTGNVYFPWACEVDGVWWVLRLNSFPDHPTYTLFVDGARRFDVDDLPNGWTKTEGGPDAALSASAVDIALGPIASWVAYGSEVGRPCDNPFCCG